MSQFAAERRQPSARGCCRPPDSPTLTVDGRLRDFPATRQTLQPAAECRSPPPNVASHPPEVVAARQTARFRRSTAGGEASRPVARAALFCGTFFAKKLLTTTGAL
ncbi:MAG: hypothetical protein IKH41_10700, partial [Clostridia bacterium]|nr:hypothetical protein [Clostridia bacterium]